MESGAARRPLLSAARVCAVRIMLKVHYTYVCALRLLLRPEKEGGGALLLVAGRVLWMGGGLLRVGASLMTVLCIDLSWKKYTHCKEKKTGTRGRGDQYPLFFLSSYQPNLTLPPTIA